MNEMSATAMTSDQVIKEVVIKEGALKGMVVAMMVASGFTETEFTELQRALAKTGATLKTISCDNGLVNGWDGAGFGHYFPVDAQLGEVLAADLDALIIPGGERSINKLKNNLNTGRIVRNMLDGYKPVVFLGVADALLTQAGREPSPLTMLVSHKEETAALTWVQAVLQHLGTHLLAAENDAASGAVAAAA